MSTKPVRTKEAENEFYVWVGKTIKCWSKVEENLFDICFLTLHPHRPAAAVVYWRQPSLDVRLNLITDLLEARLEPKKLGSKRDAPNELAEWEKIREKFRALLSFRNFIAHQPAWHTFKVSKWGEAKWDQATWDYQEFWHTKQNIDDKARRPSKHQDVGITEMKAHCAAVEVLNVQLRELVQKFEGLLVALPPHMAAKRKGSTGA